MPSIGVRVRYAGTNNANLTGEISNAICTGLQRVHTVTEEGLVDSADGVIRYQSSLEPASWGVQLDDQSSAINGQMVEILFYGETSWRRCRVIGRKSLAGIVRLNLEAEFA